MATITVENAHGTFTADTGKVDILTARYMPASVNELRRIFTGAVENEFNYGDVHSVIELLVMLASCTSVEGFDTY